MDRYDNLKHENLNDNIMFVRQTYTKFNTSHIFSKNLKL